MHTLEPLPVQFLRCSGLNSVRSLLSSACGSVTHPTAPTQRVVYSADPFLCQSNHVSSLKDHVGTYPIHGRHLVRHVLYESVATVAEDTTEDKRQKTDTLTHLVEVTLWGFLSYGISQATLF
jgi:hypothetical protein